MMASNGPSEEQPVIKESSATHTESDESLTSAGKSALFSFQAQVVFWSVSLVGLAADLISKRWAIKAIGTPPEPGERLDPDMFYQPIVLIENYLTLTTLHNPGAVGGIAAGKTTLLIVASLAALVFLFWLFASSRGTQWVTHTALGMLFAGATGNLYDRLFNEGKVIDFIEVDLHFWPANPWPTFNLADVWLVMGVAVLILTFMRGQHPVAGEKQGET